MNAILKNLRQIGLICLFVGFIQSALAPALTAKDWSFAIKLSESIAAEPYSGRVYVFFSKKEDIEPRKVFRFHFAEPIIAKDVVNWQPGETVTITTSQLSDTLTFPRQFTDVDLTGFRAQAVVRLNKFDPQMGAGSAAGEGNGYSEVIRIEPAKDMSSLLVLNVDQIAPPVPVQTTEFRKLIEVRSNLLSAFHNRDVTINAAVVLPPSYFDRPEQRYPVLFDIPSFGGTHHFPRTANTRNDRGVEFIQVELDASCRLGHHAFADSDNNGPYGTAFVQEFIPALDSRFRTVPQPTARFLTGVSSGGWSSLWVQVTHPKMFNGTWSCAPDPVDFRDFQRINLYDRGENMFKDREGNRRSLTRTNIVWFDELSDLERVLGYGGQLQSFEAVFSAPDAQRKPSQLWNRSTGEIDYRTVEQWKRFDIRLLLEQNWNKLSNDLSGKLHIHVDGQDDFLLEGAVKRLKETLAQLNSDATVMVHPTVGHGAFMTDDFLKTMANEMADRFLQASSK